MADSAWIEAMQDELHQFDRTTSLGTVDKPFWQNVNKLKWVMEKQKSEDQTVIRHQARLVAMAHKVFSILPQMDVKQAFLNGPFVGGWFMLHIQTVSLILIIQTGLPSKNSSFGLNQSEWLLFSDADSCGCLDTRKSTSEGIQFLGQEAGKYVGVICKVVLSTVDLCGHSFKIMASTTTKYRDCDSHTEIPMADMFTKSPFPDRLVSVYASDKNWYEMFDSSRTGGSDKKNLLDTSSNINMWGGGFFSGNENKQHGINLLHIVLEDPTALCYGNPVRRTLLNLPDHRINKVGDGVASFPAKSFGGARLLAAFKDDASFIVGQIQDRNGGTKDNQDERIKI
ncbi:hypothetical protein Tco_0699676 [Tanacetum coccineum]